MSEVERIQTVHLVLFVLSSALLAGVGWYEASQRAPTELTPVVGLIPLLHFCLAVGQGKGRGWAHLGSKLTGVSFIARFWRAHSA